MYLDNKLNKISTPFFRRFLGSKKRLIISITAFCILFTVLSVGIVMAFISDTTEPVKNEFVPAKVTCEVLEEFDGISKGDVRVKNTGDTSVYMRAVVVATWVKTDENGNTVTHSQVPRLRTDFVIEEGDGDNYTDYVANTHWVKGRDGFWYHLNPIQVGQESCILIKDCFAVSPRPDDAPEGYELSVEIVATAIQANPSKAVKEAWDSSVADVNADGTLNIIKYSGGNG